ncbi:MAG TPA: amidohydrolase [Clostridiales bacterium]|nr:amidohydrolase [Clostridiales bacterium]
MLFHNIAIYRENNTVAQNQFVGVEGAYIRYVGDTPPKKDFGPLIDGKDKLLLPAFYNAHAHTPMTILRGYGENMALSDWLTKKIFPFEAKLTPEMVRNSTLLGIAEMFRGGVVAATDMYFFGEAIMEAFAESGAKLNLSLGTVCFDQRGFYELPDYQENEYLFRQWHGAADGRLLVDMSIHGEYTSSAKVVAEVASYAKEKNCRMQLHLSETKKEHEECIGRHGKTPARYFYDHGLFDVPTTAAHCVWLSEEDMTLLAEKDVTVATCPVSNMKLASGIADLPAMLKKKLQIALGTDGASSNNSLSMFDDMKSLALVQRVGSGDPAALAPEEVLSFATVNGARSQGRSDCGLIKEGCRADLTLINTASLHFYPRQQLINHLIYAADNSDVVMTVVDGKIVYDHGDFPTIDTEKVMFQVERDFDAVLKAL